MKEHLLTAEMARRLLGYDQATGELRWFESPARCAPVGSRAGSIHPRGYVLIKIKGLNYAAHRVAWLIVHGRWPAAELDHRNGARSDNRISNLRECESGENNQNTAVYRSNRSGHTGVGWHQAMGKWRARIDVGGRQRHLGHFEDFEQAKQAYLQAKAELHQFQPIPRYV